MFPSRLRGLGRSTTAVLLLASLAGGMTPRPVVAATLPVPVQPLYGDDNSAKQAADLSTIFVRAIADMLADRPSGKKSARENAYAALIAIWIAACGAGAGNVAGLTTLGGGVGLAAGGIAGAALGTWVFPGIGTATGGGLGAAAGTPIGTGAGFFVGTNLTAAEFIALGIVTMHVVDHLEEEYPQTAALGDELRPGATMMGYVPPRAAWASMGARYAGKHESMFVHLVDLAFSDKLLELADKWQATPGLTSAESAKLMEMSGLRSAVQKLAYIKRNKKVSPGALQAEPVAGWMVDAQAVLFGDSQKVRDAWVSAMGLGEIDVRIDNGKLSIKPSKALKRLGTPDMIYVDLPKIEQSVSAAGNTLKASLALSGSFSVGKAELVESGSDAGLVRVKLELGRDRVIANGSLSYSGPAGNASVNAKVKSTAPISVTVYFKFSGNAIVPSRIDLGGVAVASELGGLPGPLNALANDVRNKINGAVAGAFDKARFSDAFSKLSHDSARALLQKVQPPTSAKIDEITKLDRISFEHGKIRLEVRGKRIQWPGTPDTAAAMTALRNASKAAAPSKGMPMPKGGPKPMPMK